MAKSDFVHVQLNPAGVAFVGDGGQIRITAEHLDYPFTPGQKTRVLAWEWKHFLSRHHGAGQKLFELAPEAEAATITASEPAAEAAPAKPKKGGN